MIDVYGFIKFILKFPIILNDNLTSFILLENGLFFITKIICNNVMQLMQLGSTPNANKVSIRY